MPHIEMRVGQHLEVTEGRFVDESVHRVHAGLRDICVRAGLSKNLSSVKLTVTRDEEGLDQNSAALRITITVGWSQKNVMESQAMLSTLETGILPLLNMHDEKALVVPTVSVILIVGGHRTGWNIDRRSMRHATLWADRPIQRALAHKNPLDFD